MNPFNNSNVKTNYNSYSRICQTDPQNPNRMICKESGVENGKKTEKEYTQEISQSNQSGRSDNLDIFSMLGGHFRSLIFGNYNQSQNRDDFNFDNDDFIFDRLQKDIEDSFFRGFRDDFFNHNSNYGFNNQNQLNNMNNFNHSNDNFDRSQKKIRNSKIYEV